MIFIVTLKTILNFILLHQFLMLYQLLLNIFSRLKYREFGFLDAINHFLFFHDIIYNLQLLTIFNML